MRGEREETEERWKEDLRRGEEKTIMIRGRTSLKGRMKRTRKDKEDKQNEELHKESEQMRKK